VQNTLSLQHITPIQIESVRVRIDFNDHAVHFDGSQHSLEYGDLLLTDYQP
jgi:hypothetical protein